MGITVTVQAHRNLKQIWQECYLQLKLDDNYIYYCSPQTLRTYRYCTLGAFMDCRSPAPHCTVQSIRDINAWSNTMQSCMISACKQHECMVWWCMYYTETCEWQWSCRNGSSNKLNSCMYTMWSLIRDSYIASVTTKYIQPHHNTFQFLSPSK